MTDPMNQHRSARLREFLGTLTRSGDEEEQRRIFMRRTGYTKGRVSQLLTDGFGERAAKAIAKRSGLNDGRWFDQPLGTPVGAPPVDLGNSSAEIDHSNGTAPVPVTDVTLLPEPFDHDRFGKLPQEQRQDIAQVAALLMDVLSRYSTPPAGRTVAWPMQHKSTEAQATSRTLKRAAKKKRSGE